MTNPTTNFGWQMPTPTDLVTDLPADFEVFGQAVDTDFVDLLGGTTGQVLSKTTNTDLDFTWVTPQVGDITAVNVTSPITGGGSAGAVTIGINAATTSVVGAVQLSDSTSTTSSVLASTPTATKAAYDLADAAIAKSVVTTAGDIIYRNATVPVRLGIGTANQVLKVNSGATAPEWGSAPSGLTLITRQSYTSALTVNVNDVFSSTYDNYRIVIKNSAGTCPDISMRLRVSGADNTTANYTSTCIEAVSGTANAFGRYVVAGTSFINGGIGFGEIGTMSFDMLSPNLTEKTTYVGSNAQIDSGWRSGVMTGYFNATTSFTGFSFYGSSGSSTGYVAVYGYQK
jgi:hypothetical protein